jgi:hypothetical protein
MTPLPFQIKSTLGRSYRVDLGDTRRTKEALLRLGYFKTPRYGLTQYPDEPLFAAIEAFQQDNGLSRDGTTLDADERYKLANMARNLSKRENAEVLGLPKLLPGMDIDDYKERVLTRLREALQEIADRYAKKNPSGP